MINDLDIIVSIEDSLGIKLSRLRSEENYSLKENTFFIKDDKIITLNISNSKLNNLTLIGKLTNLETLHLCNNKLTKLAGIAALRNLKILNLNNNDLSSLKTLQVLTNLEHLNISHNQVTDIIQLANLKKIKHLNVSHNLITDISYIYPNLQENHIDTLIINNNPLVYPQLDSYDIKNAKSSTIEWFNWHYDIVRKKIRDFSKTSKTTLDLGYLGITDLSFFPEILELDNIKTLILSNEWAEYSKEDGWMRVKSENSTYPNNIHNFQPQIAKLQSITHLICGGDWKNKDGTWARWQLNTLKRISHLKNLVYLNISNCMLCGQIDLTNFKNLEVLHLNNNQISEITTASFLTKLKEVYLSNNKIKRMDFISKLNAIETIDLHSNNITNLYPAKYLLENSHIEIADSKWQKNTINIHNNKIAPTIYQIIEKGKDNILTYFNQYEAELNANIKPYISDELKIMLIGNSNAGKSTLLHYIKSNQIDKNIETTPWLKTEREDFKVKGRNIKVNFFDFGGQEYYHDTHYLFFTRNSIYILLWEKTNLQQQTNNNSTDYPISYWLDSIKYYTQKRNISKDEESIKRMLYKRGQTNINSTNKRLSENPNIMIVQNKVDKISDIEFLDQRKIGDKYSVYSFFNISIYEQKGINYLIDELKNLISQHPIYNLSFLGTWGEIKKEIEKNDSLRKVYTLDEFKETCNNIIANLPEVENLTSSQKDDILFNDKDVDTFSQYLNDIGYAMYFPENKKLCDKIFLNADDIIKKMHKIFSKIELGTGVLNHALIRKALGVKKMTKELNAILDILLHFKIIFRIHNKGDEYIAPLYLPNTINSDIQIFIDLFKVTVYRFRFNGYIHKSIILDFFDTYQKNILKNKDENLYYLWKNGVIIKDEMTGELILVKFVNDESDFAYIDILSNANNSNNSIFLEGIAANIKDIIKDQDNELMINYNDNFIPLSTIFKAEEKKQWSFHFEDNIYNLKDFNKYLKEKRKMKKVFISYSKVDTKYLELLEKHLTVLKRNGTISTWNCRKLIPGEKWNGKIQKELSEANLILFLVSADFLATDYIWDVEIKKALEMQEKDPQNVRIIPIIVRSCFWEESPLGDFNTAPLKAQVITLTKDLDEAYTEAVKSILETIADMNKIPEHD